MSQFINLNSSNPAAMSGWDSKEIYMQRRETVCFRLFDSQPYRDDDTSDEFLATNSTSIDIYSRLEE